MSRWPAALAAFALAAAGLAHAGPVCVDPEARALGGIGGTGISTASGGVGGTGRPAAGGIGGTGAPIARGGIGGTGTPIEQGGIGGSGVPAAGGIGGTGMPLANGEAITVVGTITGFASVCVNGLEIHIDDHAKVSENGLATTAETLAVGQLVAVDAIGGPQGPVAHRIAVVHAVAGPVTRVLGNGTLIEIMGSPVHIVADTRIVNGGKELAVGQTVKVSAQVDAAGHLIGTRVQAAPGLAEASVAGSASTRQGIHRVGAVKVDTTNLRGEVVVRGAWTGQELIVGETQPDPSRHFATDGRRIFVEGLVQRSPAGGIMKVAGIDVRLDTATRITGSQTLSANTRVRIEGHLAPDRILRAERVDNLGTERTRGEDRSRRIGDTAIRVDRSDGQEIERSERPERLETPERAERPERVERAEKPERVERPERVEKPERIEKTERPERR